MRIPIDTVLLVVDVQQAIEAPCWGERNNPGAFEAIGRLLSTWRSCSMPVVHVRHDSVDPRSPYRPGQALHVFRREAEPQAGEPVIGKSSGSAFVGTDLEERLTRGGHTTLVVCGVLTQNSIETTVRHAGCMGFRVFLAADACQASDMLDGDGRLWPAEAVHALSLAKLDGEYAAIVGSDAACAAARAIAARRRSPPAAG